MRRFLSIALVGAVLLVSPACNGKTDEKVRAAGITPENVLAFISVNLDPAVEQKRNLLGLLRRFPDAREHVRDDFEESRDRFLAEFFEESGLDYNKDVKPWLGNEVALAVLPPGLGSDEPLVPLLVESKDDDAAKDALEKSRRSGDFEGKFRFVENFVVISNQEQEETLDDRVLNLVEREAEEEGGGLAESEAFTKVVDELHGDRLLLGWVDGREAFELLGDAGALPPGLETAQAFQGTGRVAFDLHAQRSALVLEGAAEATGPSTGGDPELTEGLPADTLGAVTAFNLATGARQALDVIAGAQGEDPAALVREATGLDLEADILSWMEGEFVLVAGPTRPGQPFPDLAAVIEPTDPARAEAALDKIRQSLAQRADIDLQERNIAGSRALVFPQPVGPGLQPAMALFADRFVVANTPAYLEALAREAPSRFADSPVYDSVLARGESGPTSFQIVLDVDPMREAFEETVPAEDRRGYESDVKPNLEPLDGFGISSRRDGDIERFEMRLTLD